MSNTWWKDPSELIGEQTKILDLPVDENLLIKGPPGSGKTNLLLLRANHLFLGDKPNLYVVVFGSVLRNFIKIGGGQYKFPSNKIITHTQLFNQILNEYDVELDTNGMSLMDARKVKASALLHLAHDNELGAIYDALLLDEAQDYFPDEIRVFKAISKTLIAAADLRQKVFTVDDCSSELQKSVDNIYELNYHFRNGREICRLADGVMQGKPDHVPLITYSSYDEKAYPSRVTERRGLTIEQQAAAIADQITTQRLTYPDELIGIMCPRNEEVASILEYLKLTPLGSEITHCNSKTFDPSRPVWLTTISSAKGLEFRAAHIAGLDMLHRTGGAQRRLAFTSITRAKTALSIYYEKSIPGYLESALRKIAPPKAVTKANIFGKD
ncbi:ATP-binding domain-containing protein [Massilia rhizosphaerae]|uniref:ATP-binding domain-containing protein n=1 Tax=Massilia rhizosphaerae TaxID=2784389 RepID=UPI0018DEC442|nr:ATP-binding domain-containing protein [Massilia rhizosphaerae]